MSSGIFNGEPEFYVAGAVVFPVFLAERRANASASTAALPGDDAMTAEEKRICAVMGLSKRDYLRSRASLNSDIRS